MSNRFTSRSQSGTAIRYFKIKGAPEPMLEVAVDEIAQWLKVHGCPSKVVDVSAEQHVLAVTFGSEAEAVSMTDAVIRAREEAQAQELELITM